MKFKLNAGAEIDFLTEQELGRRLDSAMEKLRAALREEEGQTINFVAPSFLTDGSGNTTTLPGGAAPVYRVPTGMNAYLTRLTIDYPASNFSSQTSCDARIVRGTNTPASLVSGNNNVPAIFDASKSHAPLFRDGEVIAVALTGGPHTTSIYVTGQVHLVANKPLTIDALASEGAIEE